MASGRIHPLHGILAVSADLVSVVVPAYNAAKTLDETLRSVRGQTHATLDIVVVDDGSTDATAMLAQTHADADPRVRLIRQANSGVAAARNTGWRAARSDFIALIDSDDLWAPHMVEKLLAALREGGPKVGVAYCFFAHINAHSMAYPYHYPDPCSGDVLDRILQHNFTGCGSTMLVRREALIATGGFDDSLRAAGAQGCDDYLFCCRAAEHFHFACVPEVLVGYRESTTGISSSAGRMLRSWMLVAEQMTARQPAKRDLILQGVRGYAEWMLGIAVAHRQSGKVRAILWLLLRYHPQIAWQVMTGFMPRMAIHQMRHLKGRTGARLRGWLGGQPRGRVAQNPQKPQLAPFPIGALPAPEGGDP